MNTTDHKKQSLGERVRDFVQTIISPEFWRDIRRDFKDIYTFYIDEETRQQLAKLGFIRRSTTDVLGKILVNEATTRSCSMTSLTTILHPAIS